MPEDLSHNNQLDDMIAVGGLTTVITPVIIGSAEQNVARKSCT